MNDLLDTAAAQYITRIDRDELSAKDRRKPDGRVEHVIGLSVDTIGRAAVNLGRDIVTRNRLAHNVVFVACFERGFTRRLEHCSLGGEFAIAQRAATRVMLNMA